MPRIVGKVLEVGDGVLDRFDLRGDATPVRVPVRLDGGAAVIDMTNPDSAGMVELLAEARDFDVVVSVRTENEIVRDLDIPLVVKVVFLTPPLANGDISVDLAPSHACHTLKANHPQFDQILAQLSDALALDNFVAVTETQNNEIIDVSPADPPAGDWSSLQTLEFDISGLPDTRDRLAALTIVDRARANSLFRAMESQKCGANQMQRDCIPFLFPDDGCHARAHRMCELLRQDHQVVAGKIWLFGTLRVLSPNHPDCPQYRVPWRYHVAPLLKVEQNGRIQPLVLDPSLFGHLVAPEAWKAKQGDTRAHLDPTDASIWDRSERGKAIRDSAFLMTPADLNKYRLKLKHRIRESGNPPYC